MEMGVSYGDANDEYWWVGSNTSNRTLQVEPGAGMGVLHINSDGVTSITNDVSIGGVVTANSLINVTAAAGETAQVQIGITRTASGYAHLDLIGDTTYSDFGLRIIRNNGGANTTSQIVHNGLGYFEIETVHAADIVFSTTGVERMTIESGGDVSIGGVVQINTTAPKLSLYETDQSGSGIGLFRIEVTGGQFRLRRNTAAAKDYSTSTLPFSVSVDDTTFGGDITADDFILSSDERLKDIHKVIGGEEVEYIEYNYKNSDRTRFGVSGQQVQKVIPEVVHEDEDGMLTVSYIDLLIKQIASLEARVKELEKK
jgi:hypothetical protein